MSSQPAANAEDYVFVHVADEWLIQSSAAELLRYRKMIGADRVQVWADVKKKHSSHAITADISLGATAEAVGLDRHFGHKSAYGIRETVFVALATLEFSRGFQSTEVGKAAPRVASATPEMPGEAKFKRR